MNSMYLDCCKELSKNNNSSERQVSSGQFVIWQWELGTVCQGNIYIKLYWSLSLIKFILQLQSTWEMNFDTRRSKVKNQWMLNECGLCSKIQNIC